MTFVLIKPGFYVEFHHNQRTQICLRFHPFTTPLFQSFNFTQSFLPGSLA